MIMYMTTMYFILVQSMTIKLKPRAETWSQGRQILRKRVTPIHSPLPFCYYDQGLIGIVSTVGFQIAILSPNNYSGLWGSKWTSQKLQSRVCGRYLYIWKWGLPLLLCESPEFGPLVGALVAHPFPESSDQSNLFSSLDPLFGIESR